MAGNAARDARHSMTGQVDVIDLVTYVVSLFFTIY
jgi:hypothetical protein